MSQVDIKNSLTPEDIINKEREQLETQIRNAGNWFFWIIGLSTINAIISVLGGGWHFLIGLGIIEVSATLPLNILIITYIQIAFAFGFLGFCAVRRDVWGFAAGMILYALDAVLLLLFRDWWSLGFHFLVLFFLYGGLKANLLYNKYYSQNEARETRLAKAKRQIAGASIAGVMTGVLSVITLFTGISHEWMDWMNVAHIAILLCLTFGVFKKNRACAILLFCYWIINSLYNQIAMTGAQLNTAFLAGFLGASLLWGFFFYLGILGTFTYHKIITTAVQSVEITNSPEQ